MRLGRSRGTHTMPSLQDRAHVQLCSARSQRAHLRGRDGQEGVQLHLGLTSRVHPPLHALLKGTARQAPGRTGKRSGGTHIGAASGQWVLQGLELVATWSGGGWLLRPAALHAMRSRPALRLPCRSGAPPPSLTSRLAVSTAPKVALITPMLPTREVSSACTLSPAHLHHCTRRVRAVGLS